MRVATTDLPGPTGQFETFDSPSAFGHPVLVWRADDVFVIPADVDRYVVFDGSALVR